MEVYMASQHRRPVTKKKTYESIETGYGISKVPTCDKKKEII